MRTTILIIFITAFGLVSFGQRSPVDKLLKKYDWNQGLTLKEIHPGSTEFTSELKIEGEEIEKAIASIDRVNIIKGDEASSSPDIRNAFFKDVSKALDNKVYTALFQVNADDGERVGLYANQKEDTHYSEFVLIVKETESLMMVQVKGDIDISDFNLGELVKNLESSKGKHDCPGKDNSGD
jgi:hypothetical protein